MSAQTPLIVFISGYSGAGLRTAVNTLQDTGFLCIDNLPSNMVPPTVSHFVGRDISPERGVVIRPRFQNQLEVEAFSVFLREYKNPWDFIFLTAEDSILYERYSTTRRKHPFLFEGEHIFQAIRYEKSLLSKLENEAALVVDTSLYAPKELARELECRFKNEALPRVLSVSVFSFGFKRGVLRHIDSLFDVRFLDNPFFISHLRQKTGLDKEVADYIFSDTKSQEFLSRLVDFHRWLLPQYHAEGKHYFRIGIGCTGGKHRSVCLSQAFVEAMSSLKVPDMVFSLHHRDLELPTP